RPGRDPQSSRHLHCGSTVGARTTPPGDPVMIINRNKAIVTVALAVVLSGCASQQPPPAPTVAQLAPESPPTLVPRITGATILAQQPPEVQRAIQQHAGRGTWPSFKWSRERVVPYTNHGTPLTIDVAPFQDVDLTLQPGEQIDGFALGD